MKRIRQGHCNLCFDRKGPITFTTDKKSRISPEIFSRKIIQGGETLLNRSRKNGKIRRWFLILVVYKYRYLIHYAFPYWTTTLTLTSPPVMNPHNK